MMIIIMATTTTMMTIMMNHRSFIKVTVATKHEVRNNHIAEITSVTWNKRDVLSDTWVLYDTATRGQCVHSIWAF